MRRHKTLNAHAARTRFQPDNPSAAERRRHVARGCSPWKTSPQILARSAKPAAQRAISFDDKREADAAVRPPAVGFIDLKSVFHDRETLLVTLIRWHRALILEVKLDLVVGAAVRLSSGHRIPSSIDRLAELFQSPIPPGRSSTPLQMPPSRRGNTLTSFAVAAGLPLYTVTTNLDSSSGSSC